jgi:peptidyl-prolyl cis-trans isomerase C
MFSMVPFINIVIQMCKPKLKLKDLNMINLRSILCEIAAILQKNKLLMLVMVIASSTISLGARAANLDPDPVVALINDVKFYKSDIEGARKQLSLEVQKYPSAAVYPHLLKSLIDTHLVASAARKDGLNKREKIVKQVRRIEDRVLYQAYLDERIVLAVTDEKLKALYKIFLTSKLDNEEIRARHILVETRDQAIDIIRQLNKGAHFADLAKIFSTGPSARKGGDLGYFSRERMVPPFSEGAFAIAVGKFTPKPVKTQFGWHIIKVEDKKTVKPKSFDQVKMQLRKELINDLADSIISELRNAASIKIFGPDGN